MGESILIDELIRRLNTIAAGEQILVNEPMAKHTTMRVGGPADVLFLPDSAGEVARALAWAGELGVPALLMGNGSNLIVRDGGVRGLVISLGERFSRIRVQGEELTAQAGASLKRVAAAAQEAGERVAALMANVRPGGIVLDVPLKADWGAAENWGEAH